MVNGESLAGSCSHSRARLPQITRRGEIQEGFHDFVPCRELVKDAIQFLIAGEAMIASQAVVGLAEIHIEMFVYRTPAIAVAVLDEFREEPGQEQRVVADVAIDPETAHRIRFLTVFDQIHQVVKGLLIRFVHFEHP